MSGGDEAVVGRLLSLFRIGKTGDLTDRQLLERFSEGQREEVERAFATIVDRHGPLVLRVCRGVLADVHEVEDAFQATFLILVKKARSPWVGESLAPWLYRVAYRAACCARHETVRRRQRERSTAELDAAAPTDPGSAYDHEETQILHEEINRLPDRYRMPVVLCDLEGYTHEQAAKRLEWPVGTVKSRQTRGRERLRRRLTCRGLAPSAVLVRAASTRERASPVVPRALAGLTIRNSLQWMPRAGLCGTVPARVVTLTQGVLKTMFLARLKMTLVTAALIGTVSTGVGVLAYSGARDDPRKPVPVQAPKPAVRPIRDLLNDAAKVVQSSQDPASRAYTLAEITKAQARAGDREGALTSARQAAAAALQLEPYARCAALIAIAWARNAAGDNKGALDVLRLAIKSAEALGKDDWREIGLLRWIATSQFDFGDRDAAMGTTGKMSEIALSRPDRGGNRVAYLSDVVLAQTYIGDFEGAFRNDRSRQGRRPVLPGAALGCDGRKRGCRVCGLLPAPQDARPRGPQAAAAGSRASHRARRVLRLRRGEAVRDPGCRDGKAG